MREEEKTKSELQQELLDLRAELAVFIKKAQSAKMQEKFLDRILDDSLCGIYLYNLVEGTNEYINHRYTHITGWTLDEINAFSYEEFSQLFHPDDREDVFDHMNEVVAIENQSPIDIEYRFKTKSGQWIWCLSRDAVFERSKDGIVTRLIGTFLDITERKKSDIELQKINKLESLGTLAGGIAHDFNNILLSIYGNISIAKSLLGKESPVIRSLELAENSMNRASGLSNQLLTFAKGGDPLKELFNIEDLVKEVVYFDLTGSNIKPIFEIIDDLWIVEADKGQLQQVFSNLVINSKQAMPSGGHLYVSLENAEITDHKASINAGKYIKIIIRDEGVGIDQSQLERIFDPYYSDKTSGSGLGLAMVYSIINKHDGQVSVTSELGKGTEFTIFIPATRTDQLPHTDETAVNVVSELETKRILVMDDEEVVRAVISEMLEMIGYRVETASNGQEAIDLYQQLLKTQEPIDLVILDLTVPGGMGGAETIEKLYEIDPQIKAIVSSGYADKPVVANYTDYHFKGSLLKPYSLNQLRDVLNKILT